MSRLEKSTYRGHDSIQRYKLQDKSWSLAGNPEKASPLMHGLPAAMFNNAHRKGDWSIMDTRQREYEAAKWDQGGVMQVGYKIPGRPSTDFANGTVVINGKLVKLDDVGFRTKIDASILEERRKIKEIREASIDAIMEYCVDDQSIQTILSLTDDEWNWVSCNGLSDVAKPTGASLTRFTNGEIQFDDTIAQARIDDWGFRMLVNHTQMKTASEIKLRELIGWRLPEIDRSGIDYKKMGQMEDTAMPRSGMEADIYTRPEGRPRVARGTPSAGTDA